MTSAPSRLIFLLLLGSLHPLAAESAALTSGHRYQEVDGRVVMEAEAPTRYTQWTVVEGKSGVAVRDQGERGVDGLHYEIEFTQPGTYYLFLLCRHTSEDGAEADDAFVSLDGERLWASDGSTRPDGMQGRSREFTWSGSPKAGHTPRSIKPGPVHFEVREAGLKTLTLGSRSKGFEIDKIVLQRDDATPPEGLGPAPTLAETGD